MDWLSTALIGMSGSIRTSNCRLKHDMSLLETIFLGRLLEHFHNIVVNEVLC